LDLKSRRALFPAEWRLPGVPGQFMLLAWPPSDSPECLLAVPPEDAVKLQAMLREVNPADRAMAKIKRKFAYLTHYCTLDDYGRLPIPESATAAVGISQELLFVGRLFDFEIWSPQKYQGAKGSVDPDLCTEFLRKLWDSSRCSTNNSPPIQK
jgi:DNA-binding transcriptional regulator/RsmH inhibitor MraZ